jgi:thiol-disulfide isomerase/thioredoxin
MHIPAKPILLVSTVFVLIIVAVAYSLNRTDSVSMAPSPAATSPTPTQPATSDNTSEDRPAAGAYIDYSPGILEQTPGTKVLFFHAPWCPQCRKLEASIKAGTIPANTTIIKVDYDSNQPLRKTYGVTLQTSLVRVDDSGNLVKKYVAYDDPSLEALIANTL